MPTDRSSKSQMVETLRTAEAAQALGVPAPFIRQLIELGWLDAVKPPGSQWRVTRDSIARLRRVLSRRSATSRAGRA